MARYSIILELVSHNSLLISEPNLSEDQAGSVPAQLLACVYIVTSHMLY